MLNDQLRLLYHVNLPMSLCMDNFDGGLKHIRCGGFLQIKRIQWIFNNEGHNISWVQLT